MSLRAGTRIGPYEIIDVLGAGGMGEVYRARDARLSRDVALKVVRDAFAGDPERLGRFQREAQLLAQLKHPNIGAIYGLEETPVAPDRSVSALVLELIDGETLADLIARGPLPLDEALPIARQIADALEAAHERGIIHRDLKPSNVKVTPGGIVKVLDFGLAKLTTGDAGAVARAADASSPGGFGARPDLTASPTVMSPAHVTSAGIILGTAAYMAPEQAKGKPADKRSDIWAYGCVLFEMLTGRRAFAGDEVSEVLAAVIRGEPEWAALPASTPGAVRRLLRRCLERDPQRRLRDIGDARLELDEPDLPVVANARAGGRLWLAIAAVSLLLVALASIVAIVSLWNPAPAQPLRKLDITADLTAGGAIPEPTSFDAPVRLSPDGSRAAYMVGGHLWIREFDRTDSRDLGKLPDGSYTLAWSPDGAFIGFASGDNKYRKVSVAGGPPIIVCDLPATGRITGAAWLADGSIVLAAWRESLYKVSADGGTPAVWLKVDPEKEIDFHAPEPLPGNRVMFLTHTRGLGAEEVSLAEVFDGTTRSLLLRENGIGTLDYAAPGHVVFVRQRGGGGVWAAPFESAPLDMSKAFLVDGRGQSVSAAGDGTLLIRTTGASSITTGFVRVDRAGRELEELVPAGPGVSEPVFSPDGRKLAFHSHAGGNADVWVLDVPRKVATRLTFEPGEDLPTGWSPTGDQLIYTRRADEVEGSEVASVAPDGSGTPRALIKGGGGIISPDGRYLVYRVDERGFFRIRYAERRSDGTLGPPQRLVRSDPEPTQVLAMSLSPDGRLLAYEERGTDRGGLFITRFPSGEGRWQIDTAASTQRELDIRWSRASNELFYFAPAKDQTSLQLMSVRVTADPTVDIGPPVPLFVVDAASQTRDFDIAPDGKSLVIERNTAPAAIDAALPWRFTLVQNWFAEFTDRTR